jgi:hypothetical protein
MKRTTLWAVAVALLILTAFVFVRADTRRRHGWSGHRWHHVGPASYLAHELKLSDAQSAEIRTLWEMERPILAAHLHEFLAENREMSAMAAQSDPDPVKVQEIADREATTIATLLVEKQRLQSKVYTTVLDPEQRAKADELEMKWETRMDRAADHLETQPAEK